jgi:predicted nucleic acid-binding protein
MPFVLDASVTASWAFPDEGHPQAAVALERLRAADEARVPGLWWFEVRNVLLVNERRGRISEANTTAFLDDLGRLAIALDRAPVGSRTLALARRHRLTVYDAAYLELAQREGMPLATLDAALQRAAGEADVPLLAEGAA